MPRTTALLLSLAVVSAQASARGAVLVGFTPPVRFLAPAELGGARLVRTSMTLQADPGAVVTALALKFEGGYHQVQVGGPFGQVTRTMTVDALASFPPEYAAADTHVLIPSTEFIIPPGASTFTEDALTGLTPGVPGAGIAASVSILNVALSAPQQKNLVTLIQLVGPPGGGVMLSGQVATSNDGGVPYTLPTFPIHHFPQWPEPASMGLAYFAVAGFMGIRRRCSRSAKPQGRA